MSVHDLTWLVIVVTVCAICLYLAKTGIDEWREGKGHTQGPPGPQGPPGECQCSPELINALAETTEVVIKAGQLMERIASPR